MSSVSPFWLVKVRKLPPIKDLNNLNNVKARNPEIFVDNRVSLYFAYYPLLSFDTWVWIKATIFFSYLHPTPLFFALTEQNYNNFSKLIHFL